MTGEATEQDRLLDERLNAALGITEDAGVQDDEQPPADDAEVQDGAEDGGAEDGEAAAPSSSGLSPADEQFAFEWLARAGVPRAKLNAMLDQDPDLALALARKQKETQDTIARLRRQAGSVSEEDDARPSNAAPGKTKPALPAELRRAEVLQLIEDEYGEEQRQALERELQGQDAGTGGAGQAPDPRVLAAVAASRERLVAGGHDELRDNARYLEVLRAADALRAADPTLEVGAAIDEAAEVLKARRDRALAETQDRKRSIARTQPTVSGARGVQMGLTREQALDQHIDALLSGDRPKAQAIAERYKLNRR